MNLLEQLHLGIYRVCITKMVQCHKQPTPAPSPPGVWLVVFRVHLIIA